MGLLDNLGPVKGLFGKGKAKTKVGGKAEGAGLYRSLGVQEDADFEEIQAAFLRLKEKHKGDRKTIVKYEKIKDDILDLRLKQAMAGTLKMSTQAQQVDRAMSMMENRKKKFKMPAWTQGWFVFPDKAHFLQCAWYHGFFGLFATIFPSAVMGCTALGALCAGANSINRGAPPVQKDEAGQLIAFNRPAGISIAATIGLVALGVVTGNVLGQILCASVGEALIVQESWTCLGMQFNLFFLSLFISTWKPHETNPRRGGRYG
ncbi:unnamed protein product [Chrysoparadoxa australica]